MPEKLQDIEIIVAWVNIHIEFDKSIKQAAFTISCRDIGLTIC